MQSTVIIGLDRLKNLSTLSLMHMITSRKILPSLVRLCATYVPCFWKTILPPIIKSVLDQNHKKHRPQRATRQKNSLSSEQRMASNNFCMTSIRNFKRSKKWTIKAATPQFLTALSVRVAVARLVVFCKLRRSRPGRRILVHQHTLNLHIKNTGSTYKESGRRQ